MVYIIGQRALITKSTLHWMTALATCQSHQVRPLQTQLQVTSLWTRGPTCSSWEATRIAFVYTSDMSDYLNWTSDIFFFLNCYIYDFISFDFLHRFLHVIIFKVRQILWWWEKLSWRIEAFLQVTSETGPFHRLHVRVAPPDGQDRQLCLIM